MNSYFLRLLSINNFGSSCFVNLLLLVLLLGLVGLSWIVNGLLVILGVITIIPAIILLIFKWWLKHNLVYGNCPVCNSKLTGFKNMKSYCLNCGETLESQNDEFHRNIPVSTVDVEIVDLYDNQTDESS